MNRPFARGSITGAAQGLAIDGHHLPVRALTHRLPPPQKALLRSLKPRTLEELLDALADAFASITLHDILSWFRHCGYRVAST